MNDYSQQILSYALPTPSPPPETDINSSQQEQKNKELKKPSQQQEPVIIKKKTQAISKGLNIIQRLLKEIDGRDKLMKIVQYFIKLLLHYKVVRAKFFSTIASHFSMTRKLLRLGTGLEPLRELINSTSNIGSSTSKMKMTPSFLLETIILSNAVVNHFSDDIFCLHKLGVFGEKIGDRSEVVSAYCWFAGIMVDLRENYVKYLEMTKKREKQQQQDVVMMQKIFVTEISIIKLLMDAIFCACDIWRPSHSTVIQTWSGFASGALAGYKLWIKFSDYT